MYCTASPLPRLLISFPFINAKPKVPFKDFLSTSRVLRETALSVCCRRCCLSVLTCVFPGYHPSLFPYTLSSSARHLSTAPRTLQGLWLLALNWQHSDLLNLLTSARAMNWDRRADHPNSLQLPDGIYTRPFHCDVISWHLPRCSYGSDYLLTCNFSYLRASLIFLARL